MARSLRSHCGRQSEPQSENSADIDWGLYALKIVITANANNKILEESFKNNNHNYTGEIYLI